MTNNMGKNIVRSNIPILVLLIAVFTNAVTEVANAEPLYVIADIDAQPVPLHAYNIGIDGTLSFQGKYDIPHYSLGAVGLAVDSDSKYLFVTYAGSDIIQLINATTMADAGTAIAQGANSLAGIVYDHDKKRLYCADRHTDKLYVFDWDAITTTLTPVQSSPFTIVDSLAYGIALDEINDLLYVASNWIFIRVYNTSDWSLKDTIDVGFTTVSIAVDSTNGLMYIGGGYTYVDYLTQYNLATGTKRSVLTEPDAGVMGIAVDPATGFVYISTGRNYLPGGDNIKVYDTDLKQIDVIAINGDPTGITIPNIDTSPNPLFLSKSVTEAEVGEDGSVSVGDTIVYNICFGSTDKSYNLTNISITDTLPGQVSFVTADGDGVFGQYDLNKHAYTWSISSLAPGFQGDCLRLMVQVELDTAPGTIITNSAIIDSNETRPATASVDVIYKNY
jgi:DNA-binding beta-propeller fold protein YncE